MKLNEVLLEANEFDGRWRKASSGKGVLVRRITPEMRAKEEQRKLDAAQLKRDRAKERRDEKNEGKPRRFTNAELDKIAQKIDDVIGQAVPDGDPIDRLIPWMHKNFGDDYGSRPYKFSEILDAAAKRHGYESYSEMCAQAWEAYYDQEEDDHRQQKRMRLGDLHDDSLEEPEEPPEPYERPQNPWR